MGNCLSLSSSTKATPIETTFKLPSPFPAWPSGGGFANGIINLGGLEVCQISSFNKVWATHEGGPDNIGATFFEPSSLPQGFYMLGCYSQPNNKPLFGWTLAAKAEDDQPSSPSPALQQPVDYTLVWSSESVKMKKDGDGYVWLPTAPEGYAAMGHVVTSSPEKPPLDKIRCVGTYLTDQCQAADSWIWGPPGAASDGFNVYSLTPIDRGIQARGVPVGTFLARNGQASSNDNNIACLKNTNTQPNTYMPNQSQIDALLQAYAPFIYFHPDEVYLPSSVGWFFTNGALLYNKDQEQNPVPIEPTGANLPQGGSNDGAYWLDLPVDQGGKDRVKKGDLPDAEANLHIKPMLGSTFTDIAIWIFYPFNGPARAKVQFFNVSLGKIGEHVGDWEHVTLRVSNFTGQLWSVYFSQHSKGIWVDASALEFQDGNKPVTYASLHGHAFYPKPGLVLQGSGGIGIRNDTAKSKMVMDSGLRPSIMAAEYLGKAIIEPPWLNYCRKWGPKLSYQIADEIKKVEKLLPGPLKSPFDKFIRSIPDEVLGEEGPTDQGYGVQAFMSELEVVALTRWRRVSRV
ncbi:hypothetical protein ACLB2K_073041 [Fragaria x ananassa]